jgi:hypothetical protein
VLGTEAFRSPGPAVTAIAAAPRLGVVEVHLGQGKRKGAGRKGRIGVVTIFLKHSYDKTPSSKCTQGSLLSHTSHIPSNTSESIFNHLVAFVMAVPKAGVA